MPAKAPLFASPQSVRPFGVDIDPTRIESIRKRIADARLPRQMPPKAGATSLWETGMDVDWLRGLQRYWAEQFDWPRAQASLNRFPQYQAEVSGARIHFYHVQASVPTSRTLVLIHGWPGSVVEFLDLIAPLTQPTLSGGRAEDAFNVVVPSLPGFGFSSMPESPVNSITTARLFHELLTRVIGHSEYFVQGGDFGAGVAVQMAHLFPEAVKAIHLNLVPWFTIPKEEQTAGEAAWLAQCDAYAEREFDYMRLQANKPMTPAVALVDSPLGTAAWIAEKFWAWSDHAGDLDRILPKDKLITNIMLYLVNEGGIDGSLWFYRGLRDEMHWSFFPGYIKTPTAIAAFPLEYPVCRPTLETAKRGFNVIHYTEMADGGHFAALEKPERLLADIRESFGGVR